MKDLNLVFDYGYNLNEVFINSRDEARLEVVPDTNQGLCNETKDEYEIH